MTALVCEMLRVARCVLSSSMGLLRQQSSPGRTSEECGSPCPAAPLVVCGAAVSLIVGGVVFLIESLARVVLDHLWCDLLRRAL